jgi:hypothetical protein
LKLPLDEAYRILLTEEKFKYMDMNAKGVEIHSNIKNSFINKDIPSQKKLLRLAQEIADLNNLIPTELTQTIFQRVDKKRVDMMKFIIIGIDDTPYANGAFEFDFFFPQGYPNQPPSV